MTLGAVAVFEGGVEAVQTCADAPWFAPTPGEDEEWFTWSELLNAYGNPVAVHEHEGLKS